jgi:hypothetical protein
MIVPALPASIQQSTIPTLASTDATNHPIEREDCSLIRDIAFNLICHVSKKGDIKSQRSIPKTVSNQGKGHADRFQIKCSTDHWYDGVSVASSGSHRQKHASQYMSATKGLKEIPKIQNRKARRLRLQHSTSDAGTVETQPPERDLKVEGPRCFPSHPYQMAI